MNKYIWQFIVIMFLIFGVFTTYSLSGKTYKIGDIFPSWFNNVKNKKIKDDVIQLQDSSKSSAKRDKLNDFVYSFLSAEMEKVDLESVLSNDSSKLKLVEIAKTDTVEKPAVMDTTAQRILLIGDSMLEGLMLRMRDYSEFNKHELQPVIWYSSQTEWYGKSDTLKYYINKFKPTYVMLVIGANELFVPKIIERRQKYVEHILAQIDTIKFVWIGPPNWKEDTGINDLILTNVGEKKYYPSKNLTYNRFKDGAHPTHESASKWMDSIAAWIMTKSKYPIRLNQPTEKRKGTPHAILLQPWK